MATLVNTLETQKMKNHTRGVFGSYSWSGGALKELKEFAEKSGFDVLETTVETKGAPTEADLALCAKIGEEMADKLLERRAKQLSEMLDV